MTKEFRRNLTVIACLTIVIGVPLFWWLTVRAIQNRERTRTVLELGHVQEFLVRYVEEKGTMPESWDNIVQSEIATYCDSDKRSLARTPGYAAQVKDVSAYIVAFGVRAEQIEIKNHTVLVDGKPSLLLKIADPHANSKYRLDLESFSLILARKILRSSEAAQK